ncbi:pyrroline-5-carboxylate reductase family protein, partial [Rhizobium sp.]|uniref:pyrroline-5-carboxylate reductase family protein n=1 Tax=Rhizobium sp. TaxID=391 RepID=UPI0034C5ECBB
MKILLVGCGRMGGAMAHAWSADHDVSAFDPGATLPPAVLRVAYLEDIAETAYDVVVLAVKPQAFPDVAASLLHVVADAGCLLSIMAGVTIASIQKHLGGPLPTVRAMPNMPATIGQGITVAVASAALPATALLQRLAAVRGRLSLCADQAAAAKWWLSMPMASVSAEG